MNFDQSAHWPDGRISPAIALAGLDFCNGANGFNHRPRVIHADTEVHHAYGKNCAEQPGKGQLRI